MINDHELNLLNQTFDSIYNRAYESGYEVGQKKREKDDQDYKDGLEDGKILIWQFIGKLGKLTIGESRKIFGDKYDNFYKIAYDYSPSEFIAKIKEYEDKQKAPNVAGACSILEDNCPYNIKCEECEVHCSVERAKQKVKEIRNEK